MDPTCASLDLETYGACQQTWDGRPLPEQTVFHPTRSMHTDGVLRSDLIQTCAVTYPASDPRLSGAVAAAEPFQRLESPLCSRVLHDSLARTARSQASSWDAARLSQLTPGDTMVLLMHREDHRAILRRILSHVDTLFMVNGVFDLLYMLSQSDLAPHLTHQPELIDLMELNYLHDETRPERSLKSVGPVLRTHRYSEDGTLKFKRFSSPLDPELHSYNAQDTHNALLGIAELARRTIQDHARPPLGTDKLCPWSLRWYSDSFWLSVSMSRSGICMSRPTLERIQQRLTDRAAFCHSLSTRASFPLEGTGSAVAKRTLLEQALTEAETTHPTIRGDMILTPRRQQISTSDANRHRLLEVLPRRSPNATLLRFLERHSRAQKLISTYTYPLLHHRRNHPDDQRSRLIDIGGHHFAFPNWHIIPSPYKDGQGSEGGTLQGRITAKGPPVQTFPELIKNTITSRFHGGRIRGPDLSQIELRAAALLSGDPSMVAFFQTGEGDLHRATATLLFGCAESDVTPHMRAGGKMINFWDLFLGGATTAHNQLLADGHSVPLITLQHMERNRQSRRPHLFEWQRRLLAHVTHHGQLEMPLTGQSRKYTGFRLDVEHLNRTGVLRGRNLPNGDHDKRVHEIVNQPIQTLAGNTMLCIQHRIMRMLTRLNLDSKIHMTHQVYDSAFFDCHPDVSDSQFEAIFHTAVFEVETYGYWAMMCSLTGNDIPLTFEFD